ncbi:MAG: hypothetical protein V3U92_01340 [Cellulophaga sp.]
MKIQYILILFVFISCAQNTKEKKEPVVNAQDAVDFVIDSPKEVDNSSFNKIINEIKTKTTPLIDSTNFDNFKEINFYTKQEVHTLKLEKIYPNFYKEGYNYKATASYKIEISKDYHSIVITILKGDHEMESVLINYELSGKFIDSKVVSYDEIAEGQSRIESKIEHNQLTVNNIFWMDEKQQTIEVFEIDVKGKIKPFIVTNTIAESNNINLIESVIQQLNLDKLKIKTDFISSKVQPHNPNETIVVIPEIAGDYDEHHFVLNSYIVLVNNTTGKITHKYFESSKTNDWESDALILSEITIDTAPYILAENKRAFGIRVFHYTMSQPNPYSNKNISLFVKSGDTLKNILKNYNVMNSRGRWDTDCVGKSTDIKSTLIISKEKTNGYFNILVKSKIIKTTNFEDENGDCDDKEKVTTDETLLKFNGEEYKEKDVSLAIETLKKEGNSSFVNSRDSLSIQELMLLTKDKAIKKYGTPSSIKQFILDDAQGEFRNSISDKYTPKERQNKSILIDEVTWEKDKNTWITVWYEIIQEKSVPKDAYLWRKGTEF